MIIREDQWLSSIFGHAVFKIEIEEEEQSREERTAEIVDLINCHVKQQSNAMYYARIGIGQIDTVLQLSLAGLYVVETSVHFGIDARSRPVIVEPSGHSISEILPEHHQEVLTIAGSTFRYSRFHLDPFVPDHIANQIKHDWILSYIQKKRGERLLVASIDGRPVGFLAVLTSESKGKRVGTIDLMGVSRTFQNRGVGKALGSHFIQQYQDQCDFLQVSTQAANLPSMHLYQSLGFSLVKAQYAMHMHIRDGINTMKRNENREIQPKRKSPHRC